MGIRKESLWGAASALAILGIAFITIGGIQGFDSAQEQFRRFVGYRIALAAGFGIVVGMAVRIRRLHRAAAVTGTSIAAGSASTGAMLACCSHYLPSLIPLAAVGGLATFVGKYEEPIFIAGLAANALGILYLARALRRMHHRTHE